MIKKIDLKYNCSRLQREFFSPPPWMALRWTWPWSGSHSPSGFRCVQSLSLCDFRLLSALLTVALVLLFRRHRTPHVRVFHSPHMKVEGIIATEGLWTHRRCLADFPGEVIRRGCTLPWPVCETGSLSLGCLDPLAIPTWANTIRRASEVEFRCHIFLNVANTSRGALGQIRSTYFTANCLLSI